MRRRRRRLLVGSVTLALFGVVPVPGRTAATDPAVVGAFSAPFQEPPSRCQLVNGEPICPAAATTVVLRDGRILYWNALEGIEEVQLTVVAEGGERIQNDQSRVMTLGPSGSASWTTPTPPDGGANPGGQEGEYLLPGVSPPSPFTNSPTNDGALFCADQKQLADGRILTVGGTNYYLEPQLAPNVPFGISELEGLKNARIFDPATNTWSQTGSMQYGRWYPSLVTMPDGKVFVASGVTKLIKPLYPQRLADSGTNVRQTETWDPATGQWRYNGPTADRSLPLFPRLHLLPNGHIYYDAAGQTFNPAGEAYDEALWALAASYNPATRKWKNLGIGGLGFRGSGFSVMLPLKPPYTQARFLSAGGVIGQTPGLYFGVQSATVASVNTAAGDALTVTNTGSLKQPRWYGTGVVLPTGDVAVFNGANRDEVLGPGTGFPVMTPELWDHTTGKWRKLAPQARPRTYHNTAVLLPDGRVLIGGHAPISTLYLNSTTLPGGFSPAEKDPTFEIYSPPYLFHGARPVITGAPATISHGGTFTIDTPDAASIESVVLMRNTALTHLVDADQRAVVLRVVGRTATSVTVAGPPTAAVAPPGPYMLFVNKASGRGPIPSIAAQLTVH
jgi:hypothetical protein